MARLVEYLMVGGAMVTIAAGAIVGYNVDCSNKLEIHRQRIESVTTAEVRDMNGDSIDDVVLTDDLGQKRVFWGVKEGDKTVYLTSQQIKERFGSEVEKKYPQPEAPKQ